MTSHLDDEAIQKSSRHTHPGQEGIPKSGLDESDDGKIVNQPGERSIYVEKKEGTPSVGFTITLQAFQQQKSVYKTILY